MNRVPKSERPHISFIGKRNAGKSSLINKFIGQELAIVSKTPGTTTDPVKKAIELLPFGPVVLIDTAGIDDIGELGEKRISKTFKVILESDLTIVVVDSGSTLSEKEKQLFIQLKEFDIPFITVVNKSDLGIDYGLLEELKDLKISFLSTSCKDDEGIDKLKELVIKKIPEDIAPSLIGDLVNPFDVIILVIPIDTGAPKGRIILPQVQTLREALDENCIAVSVKEKELAAALDALDKPPKLVITDSQAIKHVADVVPGEILLTTFSILMSRHKGDFREFVKGIAQIDKLKEGDKVLIAEACTHHSQKDDIGTIKIPNWLKKHTNKKLIIDFSHGQDYPQNLSEYNLIIHCGGCMINRKAMLSRIKQAKAADVPITNYGMAISFFHGAIPRALEPFEEVKDILQKIKLS